MHIHCSLENVIFEDFRKNLQYKNTNAMSKSVVAPCLQLNRYSEKHHNCECGIALIQQFNKREMYVNSLYIIKGKKYITQGFMSF